MRVSYKVILIGPTGVGKTTFIQSYNYNRVAENTVVITVPTKKGDIYFTVIELLDIASDSEYAGADCAIIMYDTKKIDTVATTTILSRRIEVACGSIPCLIMHKDEGISMHSSHENPLLYISKCIQSR